MSVERTAALLCAWLGTYFAQSTVLLGCAWLATRRLPSKYDRVAELVWRLGFGLPVLAAVARSLIPIPADDVSRIVRIEYKPDALSVGAVPGYLWVAAASIWAVVALAGVVQLCFMLRSLRVALRYRAAPTSQQVRCLAALRCVGNAQVSVVDGLEVPLALANEICLPAWVFDAMTDDECRAVVAHELAHVRRRDAIWRPLTAAVTRLFFFQPLNWLASARLRELSECICDEEAIHLTKTTIPLASALETVALRNSQRPANLSLVPAMDAGRSFTLTRVVRILSTSSTPGARPLWVASIAVVAGVAAVWAVPRVTLPDIAFRRYAINAVDPAGNFTLTVERGRVIGATISGRRLAPGQVSQRGREVKLLDPAAGTFAIQLTPDGGIHWNARKTR